MTIRIARRAAARSLAIPFDAAGSAARGASAASRATSPAAGGSTRALSASGPIGRAGLLLAGLTLAASAFAQSPPPYPPKEALFDPIASVVMHPRCLNCHQVEAPRQTDAGIPHTQRVVRGADGHGSAALQCATCHQTKNSADGKVPGADHWHLAPITMKWEGMSKAEICEQMKDPARNGNRKTPEQVIEHMRVDPLVLWAWEPGAGRSTPVISHADFLKALQAWADVGMPCPKKDSPMAVR